MPTEKLALVARFGGIGDHLLVSSVLPHLKKQGYGITYMGNVPNAEVMRYDPHIDQFKGMPEDWYSKQDSRDFFSLAHHNYDVVANLSGSIETSVVMIREHPSFWWPGLRKICNVNYLERLHDIMDVPHDYRVRFYPSPGETAEASRILASFPQPVIGWCVAGSGLDKIWPHLPRAVARIVSQMPGTIILIGGPTDRDREIVAQVCDTVKNWSERSLPRVRYVTNVPVRTALAIAHSCDAVVGPDTGIMTAVSMTAQPKVLLLSHATEENITKHWISTTTLHANQGRVPCWPCHRLHPDFINCREDKRTNSAACMSDIDADQVVDAVMNALTK